MIEPRPRHPPLLPFLASAEGEALRRRFSERAIAAGAAFDDEGRDRVLIVKGGRLRVYLAAEERELTLAYLMPGDIFSTHTRAQFSAAEPTTLLLADRRALEAGLTDFPPLRAAIIRVLARVLAQSMTTIEDLAFHDVRGRLARFFLRAAERKGAPVEPGTVVRVDLVMDEIAALLGSARQTVSTELNALIRAGVIARRDSRRFALLDPVRLRALARVESAVRQLTDEAASKR